MLYKIGRGILHGCSTLGILTVISHLLSFVVLAVDIVLDIVGIDMLSDDTVLAGILVFMGFIFGGLCYAGSGVIAQRYNSIVMWLFYVCSVSATFFWLGLLIFRYEDNPQVYLDEILFLMPFCVIAVGSVLGWWRGRHGNLLYISDTSRWIFAIIGMLHWGSIMGMAIGLYMGWIEFSINMGM